MPSYRVELDYFKPTGKYYSDGEYVSHKEHMFEIIDEVRDMFRQGKRPGLVDGPQGYIALVRVPDHPHDHPTLILPECGSGTVPSE